MKQGCLFLVAIILLCSFGYWKLLSGTKFEEIYWLPALLGIGAAIVVANIQGIFLSLKHIAKSKRHQTQWKDGDLVVLSGRIQAKKGPIEAPISGRQAVIVEYELYNYTYQRRNGKNESVKNTDYRGCLMTPCYVQGNVGQVAIIGFPLLSHINYDIYEMPQNQERVAKFLYENTLHQMSMSPLSALEELNKILKDDDGEVNANFRHKSAPELKTLNVEDISEQLQSEDSDYQGAVSDTEKKDSENEHQKGLENAVSYVKSKGYKLQETAILNGAEVTVMGTYLASRRQINVGSGLSNISHAIYLGPASKVLHKNLVKALLFTAIFTAIFIAGNYYLLQQIGINPQDLLEKIK